MVIIEAMSYGLPVVVSSVGGIPEAVNASVGALVSKNNPEDFAKEIKALILNKEDREKKGQNARELIEEKFTINKMLDKTFSVYRQLVSEDNLDSLQDNTKI
jgi:glycosyltransferase involved in cell wall biosynthesis